MPNIKSPAEQNEPINYSCTTAKFAEQINMPLWKVMSCGKYFEGRLEIDVEAIYNFMKENIRIDMSVAIGGQGTSQVLNDEGYRRIAAALSQQAKDLIKIGSEGK